MKIIVLSSGGLDSTVCVGKAIEKVGNENVVSVSFDYGQKHSKELVCAEEIANYYRIEHYVLNLKDILKYSNCSLLKNSSKEIVHQSYAEQIEKNGEGMVSTYVPFRNGLMLSAVASLAQSLFLQEPVLIYYGAHADDAAGCAYADCSEEFVKAINKAINIGTYGLVSLEGPLVTLTKAQVVAEGIKLKVPFELTWSCYEGAEKACGTCGTCIDRLAAFAANNMKDPIPYL